MNEKKKKLALIQEIVESLAKRGIVMTPNSARSRLRSVMHKLAEESCEALGIEMDSDRLEQISSSRAFQEAIANILNGDAI
jgi:hypothetical protein